MRPALDLQLKATVNLDTTADEHCRFPLKRRNYDLLREETQVPRLLIVLELPRSKDEWITISDNELILRRRAFWLSLKDLEESNNRTSVTVHIPKGNVFHIESLRALMDQSREGRIA